MRSSEPSDASGPEVTAATYAVVRHGGHQYRVTAGDRLLVDRLWSDVGAVVGLEPVLLLADGDGLKVGEADLVGVRIAATVAGHRRGRKLRIFTFKPKKRHRRTLGFRAELTELVIDRVLARGEPLPEPVAAEEADGEAFGPTEIPAVEDTDTTVPVAAAAPRRRGRGSSRAAVPPALAETEEPSDVTGVAEPDAEIEPEAPAPRRRSRAPRAGADAPEAVAPAGEAEISPSRPPTRRPRSRAAAPAAEPDSPASASEATAETEPSPETSAPKRRRAGRTTTPPEAAE